jgi:hypothetical protein
VDLGYTKGRVFESLNLEVYRLQILENVATIQILFGPLLFPSLLLGLHGMPGVQFRLSFFSQGKYNFSI